MDVGERSLAVLLRDWLQAVQGCEQRLATDHRQVGLSTTLTVRDTTDLIQPSFRHLFFPVHVEIPCAFRSVFSVLCQYKSRIPFFYLMLFNISVSSLFFFPSVTCLYAHSPTSPALLAQDFSSLFFLSEPFFPIFFFPLLLEVTATLSHKILVVQYYFQLNNLS